ncbi:MAG TPA: glycosyltransferase family 39 protein, partial [Dehalococcoidia bacterium]|nr:glycosyltransferase family 39 protein [Dehalococcoidia bacterium]
MSEQTSPLHHDSSSAAPVQASPRFLPQLRIDTSSIEWSRAITLAALVAILVLAGFLRFTHVNWDAPGANSNSGHLHPDERFLAQIQNDTKFPSSPLNYFDTDTSALNPYNIQRPEGGTQPTFVYGTLPLFLNKTVAEWLDEDQRTNDAGEVTYTSPWTAKVVRGAISAVGFDLERDGGRLVFDGGYEGHLVGRVLAGLFDLGTIVFLFLIGRRLMNRNVGLLAGFLYAVSPFPIQNSHFFIVDPYVTFFATATVFFAIRSAQDGGYRNFALAGVGAGLAAACKITAVSLLPVAMLGVGVYAWPGIKPYVAGWWKADGERYGAQQDGHALDRSVATVVLGSLVVLLAGFVAFRIAMPYAFNSPNVFDFFSWRMGQVWKFPVPYPDIMNQHWLGDQVDQQNLLSGDAAFPPNVQWIGRSKWIWPAQQMIAWGMGPALGIVAWLGVAFAAVYAIRKRQGV